jgi:hypothetical protein
MGGGDGARLPHNPGSRRKTWWSPPGRTPADSYIMRRAPGAGGGRRGKKLVYPAGDALAAYGYLMKVQARWCFSRLSGPGAVQRFSGPIQIKKEVQP